MLLNKDILVSRTITVEIIAISNNVIYVRIMDSSSVVTIYCSS